ncbi:hypothetical protein IY145_22385 [Methylosinus sp. H3A]|uniref:hypothetical protein n=1 Tax=Methylosinus sp. H3A TaxID=2785786 RepID=UPI0018C2541B|nr:hypothetical protein [Methylosinus sp. H3A]MBG0812094.1 hypothetical protein [Methylosinus sp. H3A]
MTDPTSEGPSSFFNAMAQAFDATIRERRARPEFIGALCLQAFDSFEGNLAIQTEGAPAIACAGDCPACCVLRVVATAPEVFLVARFVTANQRALAQRGVDLPGRIAAINAFANGCSESARMSLRQPCPYIEAGLCLLYRLRPLACRGHASYDKNACLAATAGADADTSISTPHLVVRSLVQNALMSSLRSAGLSWRLYELNGAVALALNSAEAEKRWIEGDDPLLPAAIAEFDAAEIGATFDTLRI